MGSSTLQRLAGTSGSGLEGGRLMVAVGARRFWLAKGAGVSTATDRRGATGGRVMSSIPDRPYWEA